MNDLPIRDFDTRNVRDILEELRTLEKSQLIKLREYEKRNQNRGYVLEAIQAEIRGPIEGYESMGTEEIIERLGKYCQKDLERILDYEEHHKTRKELLVAIHERMPLTSC